MDFINNKMNQRKINCHALDKLDKGLGLILQNAKCVTICGYKIITDSSIPFPMYLMIYNRDNNEYEFPVVNFNFSVKNILVYIADYLYNIIYNNISCDLYGNKIMDSIDIFKQNITVNGYKLYDDNVYLFLNLTETIINIEKNYSNRYMLDWGLMTDFTNTKCIYDKKINEKDCLFVENNIELFLIRDSTNKLYEPPHTGYIGTKKEKANYIFNFGPPKSSCEREFGACYYFTNYTEIQHQEAFVRFALFYGNNCVKQNFPNDTIDESKIKKYNLWLYNDSDLQFDKSQYETQKLTMRITDHDGLWQKTYDSVILSEVELDNGEIMDEKLIIGINSPDNFYSINYFA